jgi:hypothetical protein
MCVYNHILISLLLAKCQVRDKASCLNTNKVIMQWLVRVATHLRGW